MYTNIIGVKKIKISASRIAKGVTLIISLLICFWFSSCASKPTMKATMQQTSTETIEVLFNTPTPGTKENPTSSVTVSPNVQPISENTGTYTPTSTPIPIQVTRSNLIAFTMMLQNGRKSIFSIKPDSTQLTRLDQGPEDSFRPQWSPDGQKIAYLKGNSNKTAKLTILEIKSGIIQQIDYPGVDAFAWSPDSKKLIFAPFVEVWGGEDYNLDIVSLEDLKPQSIYTMAGNKRIVNLKWSPKGDRILAMISVGPGIFLWIFSLSGDHVPVDTNKMVVYDASWDPSGEKIAIAGVNFGDYDDELWLASNEGIRIQLLIEKRDIFYLRWSPDGKSLAFSSRCCNRDPSGIYLLDLESLNISQVIPPENLAYNPGWSPDGIYLAFLSATEDLAKSEYALNVYSFVTKKSEKIIKDMVTTGPVWSP